MIFSARRFMGLLVTVATLAVPASACKSCLFDLTASSLLGHDSRIRKHSRHRNGNGWQAAQAVHSSNLPFGLLGVPRTSAKNPSTIMRSNSSNARRIDSPAFRFLVVRKLLLVAYNNSLRRTNRMVDAIDGGSSVRITNRWAGGLFIDESPGTDDSLEDDATDDEKDESKREGDDVMSGSMIMAIGFYKSWISPLLPPACRFLPTCSQYGVQAIKEFGPQKGVILTAWRLARCTPLGGKGYDPPKWPPVHYTYGSY